MDKKGDKIKKVYEKYKHMNKLFCDEKMRASEANPFLITMFNLWDAIVSYVEEEEIDG